MFTIFPSQISSFLFFTPYPTPNFVVYCCGPVRLRSKHSWSLCPARPVLRPAVRFLQFPLLRLLPSSPPCSHSLVKFYTVSVFLLYLLSWSYCHQNLNGLTSITCFHSVSQNLTGATLQQPLSLWFFDLLRTQNAPSESKLFSPISLLKHCCFSVDFPFFCLFFSFFLQMNVHTVGGFAFQLDLLVVIDCAWAQSWVKSGHTECGQRTVQWQMS